MTCHASPLGLLIHPDYGLWHGYRGALLFAATAHADDKRFDVSVTDAKARQFFEGLVDGTLYGNDAVRNDPTKAFAVLKKAGDNMPSSSSTSDERTWVSLRNRSAM